MTTMSQVLVISKPDSVSNVCIQETYSINVPNKLAP